MRLAKKNILTFIFFVAVFAAFAQPAILKISSATQMPFYLAVNDTLIDTLPKPSYLLSSANAQDVNIVAYADSLKGKGSIQAAIIIGRTTEYDVLAIGSSLQLLEVTSYPLEKLSAKGNYHYIDSLASLRKVVLTDSLDQAFYLKQYGSKAGCIPPINDKEFELKLKNIEEAFFTQKRLELTNELLKEQCLHIYQLNQLWPLFDFDEPKLELLGLLKGNVFDPYDAAELAPKLITENARERFEEVIKTLSQD